MADNLNFFNDLLPIDTDKEKQLEEQNQFANLKDNRLCNCRPTSGVKRYGVRFGKWFFGVTKGN